MYHGSPDGVGGVGMVKPLMVSAAENTAEMGPTWALAPVATVRVAVPAVAGPPPALAAALTVVMGGAMGVG